MTTFEDFAQKFRSLAGDESQSIPDDLIINGFNWALNSLPSVPKLDKAFARHYTKTLDARGHFRWVINGDFRYISNSPMMNFYTTTGGDPCQLNLCYQDVVEFYKLNGLVEKKCAGMPCKYTLERDGDKTYLVFDRPTNIPIIVDYIVWGYPKPITSMEDKIDYIQMSAPIENLILQTMRKIFYEEADDLAFSGAFEDKLDNKYLPEAIQMVNKMWKTGTPIIIGEP